jgi:hypothetical protein
MALIILLKRENEIAEQYKSVCKSDKTRKQAQKNKLFI